MSLYDDRRWLTRIGITDDELLSSVDDLHESSARFNVPAQEQNLLAIAESTNGGVASSSP